MPPSITFGGGMSLWKRIGKRTGVDFGDFNVWLDGAMRQGSPRRALLDRYDRSLKAIEVAEARLEVWVMVCVDKPGFEASYRKRGKRLAELERASVAVLEQVFRAYRQDKTLRK
jgi:hypothetical protein